MGKLKALVVSTMWASGESRFPGTLGVDEDSTVAVLATDDVRLSAYRRGSKVDSLVLPVVECGVNPIGLVWVDWNL